LPFEEIEGVGRATATGVFSAPDLMASYKEKRRAESLAPSSIVQEIFALVLWARPLWFAKQAKAVLQSVDAGEPQGGGSCVKAPKLRG
jgi:hypothetical protein